MKVVVTSGPMNINIDQVRCIQNSSSGRLGSLFAEKLSYLGQDVVYVHTKDAIKPLGDTIKLIEVENQNDLQEVLNKEIGDCDICIHAIAVSDFKYRGSINLDTFTNTIIKNKEKLETSKDIIDLFNNTLMYPEKLDSKTEQILYMEPGIKIVDEIKKINTKVQLVSFKLLSEVSTDELISVGEKQLIRTSSTIVVANLMENVSNLSHKAIIINEHGVIAHANDKTEIVNIVLDNINLKGEK